MLKAYLKTPDCPFGHTLLTRSLSDVSELLEHGFLNMDSSVWIRVDSGRPDMITLTDRASYVYVHDAWTAGFARITKNEIRWGESWASTLDKPSIMLSRKDHDALKLADYPMTLIVRHHSADQRVSVTGPDRRKSHTAEGIWEADGLTVVDLPAYRPRPIQIANQQQRHMATTMGSDHMTRNSRSSRGASAQPDGRFTLHQLDETLMDAIKTTRERSRELGEWIVTNTSRADD